MSYYLQTYKRNILGTILYAGLNDTRVLDGQEVVTLNQTLHNFLDFESTVTYVFSVSRNTNAFGSEHWPNSKVLEKSGTKMFAPSLNMTTVQRPVY